MIFTKRIPNVAAFFLRQHYVETFLTYPESAMFYSIHNEMLLSNIKEKHLLNENKYCYMESYTGGCVKSRRRVHFYEDACQRSNAPMLTQIKECVDSSLKSNHSSWMSTSDFTSFQHDVEYLMSTTSCASMPTPDSTTVLTNEETLTTNLTGSKCYGTQNQCCEIPKYFTPKTGETLKVGRFKSLSQIAKGRNDSPDDGNSRGVEWTYTGNSDFLVTVEPVYKHDYCLRPLPLRIKRYPLYVTPYTKQSRRVPFISKVIFRRSALEEMLKGDFRYYTPYRSADKMFYGPIQRRLPNLRQNIRKTRW